MKTQNYEEFVEKFKPQKTTDDCYTPSIIYDTVSSWVAKEYNINKEKIVRPFYPGGDYEKFNYLDDSIVVDNPPFSCLSKILKFYVEKRIEFFLFAPALTLFSTVSKQYPFVTCIITDSSITYENGACVKTCFITNLDNCAIRTAPELSNLITESDRENHKINKKELPRYIYPDEVITSTRLFKVANNCNFKVYAKDMHFLRALDSQKSLQKTLFGAGFLISKAKAAELKAAELKAAKLAIQFELSEKENEIIKKLGI